MNVKELYEILGKYIEVGAGEWVVVTGKRRQFKTRKEYREWLKSNSPGLGGPAFDVGEVMFAAMFDVEEENYGARYAVLCPSFFIKDENKAMYYLPGAWAKGWRRVSRGGESRVPKHRTESWGPVSGVRLQRTSL
jgi:hypothetical protein